MDKQKLTDIYNENAKAVYRYLLSLTRDVAISEELTQEVFYQATKGIDKFRGDCKVSVWLCQIAKRLWYKEINSKRREWVSLDEIGEISMNEDIEEKYILNNDKMELFRKLHTFDERTKEVMFLRLTGELSYAEIGSIFGNTEEWARVTFHRGKKKLVEGYKE